jgi:hypothetical protein
MSVTECPEQFLYWRLTTHTSVSSLVGTRVYPVIAPMGTALPLIVYQRTNVTREQSLAGPVGAPVVSIQMTSYATSYTACKQIARGVRLAVDGWTGTTQSVTITRTSLESESDGVMVPTDDTQQPYYSVQQAFDFRVMEAT